MKLKSLLFPLALFFTLLSLLLLSACNLFGPNTTTYNVTLASGEIYEVDLERSGDEESAGFVSLPLHASISETYRDTVNYSIHYRYQAENGYIGTDYVKFALRYHENPWDASIKTTGYVEINFNIIDN
ncbi:MAG: hypothetical protein KAU44_00385 [Candidatus Marinimicrobia bacterium]|nr:hypothetical protein [Candidatus Neomarinimicrobiota bacterium]